MKRKLKIVVILFSICLFVLLVYGIASRIVKADILEASIQSLPEFKFHTLDGRMFNSSEIKTGPVLVTYFHPECEHCRYEIDELLSNLQRLGESKLVLISYAQRDSIKAFIGSRINKNNTNVFLLADSLVEFKKYFGTNVIPSIFIYDRDLKLIRFFKGEVKPETIINLLQNGD